ncbi:MAG: RNA polymerase sigma factor [Verrucomicrobiales bacterium]|nr:RNA polymerase sigma factor [Verrucomicrobiales bacterium]MCP5559183.1 RNA polymerase sigma factor [Verrucomicrobiaceae bacterium]
MDGSPPSGLDLAALVTRIRARDQAAAHALVEWLGPQLLKIARSYPTLQCDIEDTMQEIFLKIFKALPSWRNDGPLEHWASRIARHACLDRLRRQNARPLRNLSDLTESEAAAYAQALQGETSDVHGESSHALIERLFTMLNPLDAWLLRQVELLERDLAEVAVEAGWNRGLAHVRLFRARHRLRQAFEKLESQSP